MTLEQQQLIEKLKKHALDNYENGGDGFVECYGQEEWMYFINGKTEEECFKLMATLMDIQNERWANARIEGGEW